MLYAVETKDYDNSVVLKQYNQYVSNEYVTSMKYTEEDCDEACVSPPNICKYNYVANTVQNIILILTYCLCSQWSYCC